MGFTLTEVGPLEARRSVCITCPKRKSVDLCWAPVVLMRGNHAEVFVPAVRGWQACLGMLCLGRKISSSGYLAPGGVPFRRLVVNEST